MSERGKNEKQVVFWKDKKILVERVCYGFFKGISCGSEWTELIISGGGDSGSGAKLKAPSNFGTDS